MIITKAGQAVASPVLTSVSLGAVLLRFVRPMGPSYILDVPDSARPDVGDFASTHC